MIFNISELPKSKYAFSRKCLSVCLSVRVRVRVCVVDKIYLWQLYEVHFEVVLVQFYS